MARNNVHRLCSRERTLASAVVRRARHKLGLRQLDAALAIDVTERSWRRWETRDVETQLEALLRCPRLARAVAEELLRVTAANDGREAA